MPLSLSQAVRSAAYGLALWFGAAMFIRFQHESSLFQPSGAWINFLAAIPFTWLALLPLRRLAQLGPNQLVPAVSAGTAAAAFADSIALTWFPALYGLTPSSPLQPAAWILWGAGVGLLLSFLMERR